MVAIMALGLIACVRETFSLFWGIVSLMIYPGPKKENSQTSVCSGYTI
jgi:hypothetical protein